MFAVEQYVWQALLPRCSVVVCHAGAGTIFGALAHRVPLVCLRRGADRFGNPAQISRIGAGIRYCRIRSRPRRSTTPPVCDLAGQSWLSSDQYADPIKFVLSNRKRTSECGHPGCGSDAPQSFIGGGRRR
jgi:hypothetical protein